MNIKDKLTESTMLALQGKLTEQDVSNHLFRAVYALTAAYKINKEYHDVSNERM